MSWSVNSLLGLQYNKVCEAVKSSHLIFLNSNSVFKVETAMFNVSTLSDKRVLFSLPTKQFVNIPMSRMKVVPSIDEEIKQRLSLVSVDKYVAGHGNVRGGVKILLTNRAEFHIKIILFDHIPWFIQVFYHKLKIYTMDPQTFKRTEIIPGKL